MLLKCIKCSGVWSSDAEIFGMDYSIKWDARVEAPILETLCSIRKKSPRYICWSTNIWKEESLVATVNDVKFFLTKLVLVLILKVHVKGLKDWWISLATKDGNETIEY